MNRFVYLDYNATTPLHPEVKRTLAEGFDIYGNASSMHSSGRRAAEKIEEARGIVAAFLGAEPGEIIFTGGGSESNNTVLNMIDCGSGRCSCVSRGRKGLLTTTIEHPSVINAAEFLAHKGVPVTFLPVDGEGKLDMEEFEAALSSDTALVSVMLGNNEIGTLQDIKTITRLAHSRGALMHTDAVQAVGKVPINVRELDVDFLSFSAHKLYGPKGVGILYVRKGAPFCTFIHGGHQEEGRRAGTYNTLGIIGLGKAIEVAGLEMRDEVAKLWSLREKLREGLLEKVPDIHINGHPSDTLPGTLNVSFRGAEGEAMLLYLDMHGIQVSTGSACASGSLEPSPVLLATGAAAELAHGSLRFSLGRETTEADIDYVLEVLPPVMRKIRTMSTVYSAGR
ncbi:MAG: aminotransferase class V-fold PLP-dependent enzyme [Spirochaetales bacterium]|jgi:cysteine desulfurase|nr:aminotransferase class V-fold PLP-dependent enzyme [Spirochaetales bacterium]